MNKGMPAYDLRLYDYAASANCYKARLLLAQLERPYERVPIDIFNGDTLTDHFARINPSRSTPVLEVMPGKYLTESNAILFYLAEGTPLLPSDSLDKAQVVRWMIYEQTDVVPGTGGLRFRLQTERLTPEHPDAIRRKKSGEEVISLLDVHLAEREFFVGDRYTVADISVYSYVHVAHEAGFDMNRYPAVQAWLERVAGQPGYVNDLEPYPPNARPGAGRSIYDQRVLSVAGRTAPACAGDERHPPIPSTGRANRGSRQCQRLARLTGRSAVAAGGALTGSREGLTFARLHEI